MAQNTYIENYNPEVKFAAGVKTKLPVTVNANIAPTSGGVTTPGVVFGSTVTGSGAGIYFGAGAPTITAPQGSLYLNTSGSSTSTRAYVNTTGSTTWTAITTVG